MLLTQSRRFLAKLPKGFLGALVLIALVEASFSRHWKTFSDVVSADWRVSGELARGEAPKANLLIVGDSQLKFSVLPRILNERLGVKSCNMAAMGAQASTTYFLLRQAIDSGAKPATILFDCNDPPINMNTNGPSTAIQDHERNWPEALSWRDTLDLAYHSGDSNFLAGTTLAKIFPSIRSRIQIRKKFAADLKGEKTYPEIAIKAHARNIRENLGAFLCAKKSVEGRELAPYVNRPDIAWKSNPLTLHYLRQLLDLARQHQIQVIWVIPPSNPGMAWGEDLDGTWPYTTELARSVQSDYPEVTVIDGRHAVHSIANFVDGTHVDRDGAVMFSEAVARTLQESWSRPSGLANRWVELPTSETITAQVALEDFAESSAAVQRRSSTDGRGIGAGRTAQGRRMDLR